MDVWNRPTDLSVFFLLVLSDSLCLGSFNLWLTLYVAQCHDEKKMFWSFKEGVYRIPWNIDVYTSFLKLQYNFQGVLTSIISSCPLPKLFYSVFVLYSLFSDSILYYIYSLPSSFNLCLSSSQKHCCCSFVYALSISKAASPPRSYWSCCLLGMFFSGPAILRLVVSICDPAA